MKHHLALILTGAVLLGCGLTSTAAATVTVFAAASLSEALREIGGAYEKQSGDSVRFNFAASGTLARQLEEGAPADIFFSADEGKMDGLEKKGLLVKGTRQRRLSNSLVIVAADAVKSLDSPTDLTNASIGRLALGDPRTVPAGTYARAYLEKAGLWQRLEPKVVPCENVRAVLAAVESGNVDAGIVYKTDAAISRTAKVCYEVPAAEGPRISYPVALLKQAPAAEPARRFLAYLAGPRASAVFTRRGFVVLPAGSK